ncbi:hypothetical protein CDAR_390741 [Caerostris darwini]|uniref:Sushi domain-containing protein n=1 Tax=Caerostris darwini TaxID=1538125 RepID=A0AAV4U2S6_9ARAC|nr:hypothetical protein CDAR_390741 [Caerostris darwini]
MTNGKYYLIPEATRVHQSSPKVSCRIENRHATTEGRVICPQGTCLGGPHPFKFVSCSAGNGNIKDSVFQTHFQLLKFSFVTLYDKWKILSHPRGYPCPSIFPPKVTCRIENRHATTEGRVICPQGTCLGWAPPIQVCIMLGGKWKYKGQCLSNSFSAFEIQFYDTTPKENGILVYNTSDDSHQNLALSVFQLCRMHLNLIATAWSVD